MACDFCQLPQTLAVAEYLIIWPPQGHTRHKLSATLQAEDLEVDERAEDNCLIVSGPDVVAILTILHDTLTENEAADTRILCSRTKTPALGDFGQVSTVVKMMERVRGDWLISLLADKRYLSYAQPIVAAAGDHPVVAHEYLLRGLDTDGKMIPPDTLFEAARDPRIFFNLDRSARISAVETAAKIGTDADVFINFMPGSIYDPAVCLQTTVKAAAEAGVSPSRVVFEIVESQRIENLTHLRGIINYYRNNGFRVALDDFGAGHSNMEAFIALKPNFVKLDKSLTMNLTKTDERTKIVQALIQAFHANDIKVVAEGIESAENAQVAIECGADLLQGYHFGRPQKVTG